VPAIRFAPNTGSDPARRLRARRAAFDGDPDVGKSVVTMDLAARISTGRPFPDGAPREAGNVSICNVEDDAGDTIVPRLKAHSADLSRIFLFSEVPDGKGAKRLLELPKDIEALAVKLEERQAVLLILGSVITLLGSGVNEDQDARRALAPVKSMAERLGVAIVGVRHLNKSVNLSAIQRGGNMGLIGVARIGAFFAHHPEQEGMRVMAPHKSNPAEKPPGLAYKLVNCAVHGDEPRVERHVATDHDANALSRRHAKSRYQTKPWNFYATNFGTAPDGQRKSAGAPRRFFFRSASNHAPAAKRSAVWRMYRGCYVLYNFYQEAGRFSFGPTKEKRPAFSCPRSSYVRRRGVRAAAYIRNDAPARPSS
jgi:hypothetical protein